MTEERTVDHDRKREGTGTDAVAKLLRAAGRRPEPPAAAYEETLGIATDAWRRKLGAGRRRRRAALAAVAAVVVAGVAVVLTTSAPPAAVFAPDRIVGRVEWSAADADWVAVGVDAPASLPAGSLLRTRADAYAGLRLAGGGSLRVAPDSSVRLAASGEIELVGGRLYVDSGPGDEGQALVIVTPAGRAVEIGTQFEVSYRDDRYRLRVREGRVRLERPGGDIENRAGEELTIGADGSVGRARVDATAADWRWTLAVAPMPAIDGRPVTVLLEWVSRETGRGLRYATPALREQALKTILHGHVEERDPMDLLDAVLATTDFDYRIATDGTIEILARTPQ